MYLGHAMRRMEGLSGIEGKVNYGETITLALPQILVGNDKVAEFHHACLLVLVTCGPARSSQSELIKLWNTDNSLA